MTGVPPDAIVSRIDDDGDNERSDVGEECYELLTDHAKEVSERAQWLTRTDARSDTETGTVLRCLGSLHDVGKAVPAFQAYIRNEQRGRGGQETYHARLGAFAVAHVLSKLGASEADVLAGWLAVLKHHGALPDCANATHKILKSELFDDNAAYAVKQVESIDEAPESRATFDALLDHASNGATSWAAFRDAMDRSGGQLEVFTTLLNVLGARRPAESQAEPDLVPDNTYDRAIRFWSGLTFADKTAASGNVSYEEMATESLELEVLESHVDTLLSESGVDSGAVENALDGRIKPEDERSLNALRESARRRVRETAPRLCAHEVGTLTLPTGLGKTFSGITGAFTLRDEIAARRSLSSPPLVVYALPYTSIIEQTREIFEEEVFDADPTSKAFTTHHSLTETVTYTENEVDEEGNAPPDQDNRFSKARLLAESWRSGVVLTTFVQLFESLAGPSNGAGLKLPALHDAVVVLDEPQALPKPWWGAVRRLSRTLIDEFDARVISMTATQPTLFTDGTFDTISLLASDHSGETEAYEQRMYESVSRVQYRVDDSVGVFTDSGGDRPVSHATAADRLIETALSPENRRGTSALSVCSTVSSSRTLTERVVEQAALHGIEATHIGKTYQTALEERDTDANNPPPDPSAVAAGTLEELGFVEGDDSWSLPDGTDDRLFVGTFNAQYRPLDRRAFVEIADVLSTAEVPFVFVSTQAIEAGVDISFNHAFRDIAPLDSVVQTAGRCNRSFEWDVDGGTTTIWCLDAPDDDDTSLPVEYIYPEGGHLRRIASILLEVRADAEGDSISTADMELDAVSQYFAFVEERNFSNEELVNWIDGCEANRLGQESLLGDSYETVDLLVAATSADNDRIEDVLEAFERYEGEGYDRLSDLAGMRVSVPVKTVEESLRTHVRVDGSARSGDGVSVFAHPIDHGRGSYDLDGGGFVIEDSESVLDRFSF